MTLIIVVFLISLVGAEVQTLPIQRTNTNITIPQTCSNCSYINITKIRFPNSSEIYPNVEMSTSNGINYFYSFYLTALGDHIVTTCGDVDGVNTCVEFDFEATKNGEQKAGDIFRIFIYLLFIIATMGIFVTFIFTILKIAMSSETILGVMTTWFFFILMIFVHYLGKSYLNESFIENLSGTFITVTTWTNGVLPLISLVIVMFVRGLQKKKPISPEEITGRRFMSYG